MTMQFVTDYIDKKLKENPNYIRYVNVKIKLIEKFKIKLIEFYQFF